MKQFNTFFKGFNRTLVYYLEVICLKAQAQQNFRKGIQEGLLEYYKLKQRLPVGGLPTQAKNISWIGREDGRMYIAY